MNKKLLCFAVSVLFVMFCVSQVRAEMSASAYSGKKYYEQTVKIAGYNNGTSNIAENHIVIFDTGGSRGDSLGAYIATSSTNGSPYVVGVSDEVIEAGTSGRICVRGPHQVLTTGDTVSAGLILGQSGTTGLARVISITDKGSTIGQLGVAIGQETTNTWWVWVDPQANKIVY